MADLLAYLMANVLFFPEVWTKYNPEHNEHDVPCCRECGWTANGDHDCPFFRFGCECLLWQGEKDLVFNCVNFVPGPRLDLFLGHCQIGHSCSLNGDCSCVGGKYYNYCGNYPRLGQIRPINNGRHKVDQHLREALEIATAPQIPM